MNDRVIAIEKAIEDLKKGKMVVVLDDKNRENEGDLIMIGSKATPESINFISKHARGLICVSISSEKAQKISLEQMVKRNTEAHHTAFTVSLDAKEGTTTGISSFDIAKTINQLSKKNTSKDDFRYPGHVFPLVAKKNGVLERNGHTEAASDLVRLATGNNEDTGVLCEILSEDGSMAREKELRKFSKRWKMQCISVEDLIFYRKFKESLVKKETQAKLPTSFGDWKISVYSTPIDNKEHIALIYGSVKDRKNVLTRIHSECLTGDLFSSLKCDCGPQLYESMRRIEQKKSGIIIYLRQEGRGIGLVNKIKAYHLQDKGRDTVEANIDLGLEIDKREYSVAAQILKNEKVASVELLTNNPEKVKQIKEYGVGVSKRIPLEITPNKENKEYLEVKKHKMGHLLTVVNNDE